MERRFPSHRMWQSTSAAATIVVIVLIASVVVAAFLAAEAIGAARSRQAVSEAMLRQYAQLAASEYSREARKDLETAMTRAFMAEVHQRMGDQGCDCGGPVAVEHWFEISPDGLVTSRRDPMPTETLAAISRVVKYDGGGASDGNVRIVRLSNDDARMVAVRWEPHVGTRGGYVGLVTRLDAVVPILTRTHRRAVLLPPLLAAGRDAHALVDLHVSDGGGRVLFASSDTTAGPQPIETALLPETDLDVRVQASMTPVFVAGLGPEHGGGPNNTLLVGLVVVNAVMVVVGVWLLVRERELARLRADFVAGVSHELRTPLAQIRMFAETLLLDRIRNPTEGRRALEIIGQETRRLSQLVENVLYFHRHRRHAAVEPHVPVELSELVSEVAEGFGPLAASRRVRLDVRLADTAIIARADADGLRQVLLNLLDNAVKFGPTDEPVSIDLDSVDGAARIAIEDRGPGVPLPDRLRIFRPFERGRDSRAGGAGIGLAVVHEIVQAHGGQIRVEQGSNGRGARFVVVLPLANDELGQQRIETLAG